jgi:prepilin-type N-terminal cleavage/methylation domain-containing protein
MFLRMKNGTKSSKGYTLIELLIVVLILGALAVIVIPRIPESAAGAKVNTCKTNVRLLNSQIELYKVNNGSWPIVLTDVTGDIDYFPDGPPKCPFDEPYIYNPITHRVEPHNHGGE